ncbi:MAG: phosphate ABC transporter permease PstA [Deltaproteobacteria bacterium]|nr:phosphate ABC transporter permease PstA [Deltaproteobacteria bacterium]
MRFGNKTATRRELIFYALCLIVTSFALTALLITVGAIVASGALKLNLDFLLGFPSRKAEQAGILPALLGSAYIIFLVAVVSVPIGVLSALFFEEYLRNGPIKKMLDINLKTLAGVPSIVYGLIGLQIFVRTFDLGRSILAGALTISLLILPVVVIASREAIRQVPGSFREASYALGATKFDTIWRIVIPFSLPGIITGSILALSRAIGEAAPLICLGALTYVAFIPDGLFSPFTTLPIQAFNWISRPQPEFHQNAAGAILILIILLLIVNSLGILIRLKLQKRLNLG